MTARLGGYDYSKHEVPVFNVNFYLMGMEEVDNEVTVQIGENIDYLNQEFEGRIKFRLNQLFMDPNHAYIPDLHAGIAGRNKEEVESLVQPIELQGGINVFLFDTYGKEGSNTAMMGFTPVLRAHHDTYAANSPRFDRLYIAYPGLIDKSTLVHEMGHFLGLSHPWELNKATLYMLGLEGSEKTDRNHMTYNMQVDEFTTEQLDRMQHFALNFRKYLLQAVEVSYK